MKKQIKPDRSWLRKNPRYSEELFLDSLVTEINIDRWFRETFPKSSDEYRKEWHLRVSRGTFFINMDDNSLKKWTSFVEDKILKRNRFLSTRKKR